MSKNLSWMLLGLLLLLGGAALLAWRVDLVESKGEKGKVLTSRRIVDIAKKRQQHRKVRKAKGEASEDTRRTKPNLELDSEDESKLTGVMKQLYTELQSSLDADDKKKVFSLVQKMQTMDEWPDGIPLSVKFKALEALKWFGAAGAPEIIGFLEDGNPEVESSAVDALTEMMSDASIGDRALADIIKQLVKVVTDLDALDTLVMGLNDMRNSVRVETAQAIYASGNDAAIKTLDENVEFLFCDGEVSVHGRGDLAAYEKANPDGPDDEDFYGPAKE